MSCVVASLIGLLKPSATMIKGKVTKDHLDELLSPCETPWLSPIYEHRHVYGGDTPSDPISPLEPRLIQKTSVECIKIYLEDEEFTLLFLCRLDIFDHNQRTIQDVHILNEGCLLNVNNRLNHLLNLLSNTLEIIFETQPNQIELVYNLPNSLGR